MVKKKVVIMGAAGRDFHNFNMCFRDNPLYHVVAFTAAQIPFIEKRVFPPELSGRLYPKGIPIYPEEKLRELIEKDGVDEVVFSYSDVSHEYVMHRASLVTALGADFSLLGAERTMLDSSLPVISVCAVRTGAGKSGVTRFVAKILLEDGKKPVAVRHPMPYGELLARRKVQRFASPGDIDEAQCTIEEREEFEHLVKDGITVFAGIDYAEILKEAEKESDVIIWDGGNNDLPFIRPGLEIVVADPLRPGHELLYWPGEANLVRAHCVVLNKVNSAREEDVKTVSENIARANPKARIVKTSSVITVDARIEGKKVLVVEDGPTITHGGMAFGAGAVAAKTFKAEPVDPRPYAVGTIKEAFEKFPGIQDALPALGYSSEQVKELEETINRTQADAVLAATPIDLSRLIKVNKPVVRVSYEIRDIEAPGLKGLLEAYINSVWKHGA